MHDVLLLLLSFRLHPFRAVFSRAVLLLLLLLLLLFLTNVYAAPQLQMPWVRFSMHEGILQFADHLRCSTGIQMKALTAGL